MEKPTQPIKSQTINKIEEHLPKAVKVVNMANILQIEFDNGVVKYLKSHWTETITDALSPGKGKGKRASLLVLSRNMWVGTEVVIEEDGTVVLNGTDRYSPEELWKESRDSIAHL